MAGIGYGLRDCAHGARRQMRGKTRGSIGRCGALGVVIMTVILSLTGNLFFRLRDASGASSFGPDSQSGESGTRAACFEGLGQPRRRSDPGSEQLLPQTGTMRLEGLIFGETSTRQLP